MRLFVILLGLAAVASTCRAAAPDSVAGKYFRYSGVTTAHSYFCGTVLFRTDGSTSTLFDARGGLLYTPNDLFEPAPDGRYAYERTDDSSAQLILYRADGTIESTYNLSFASDNSGAFFYPLGAVGGSFVLTDANAIQSAPILNASLRGSVGPGHALIAGFVIPSGAVPYREILVRVSGPSLSKLGVTGAWADPDFKVFQGSAEFGQENKTQYDSNYIRRYSDWSALPGPNGDVPAANGNPETAFKKLFAAVGAFPFDTNSKDAAQILRLKPGAYTVVANPSANDSGGETLIEIYLLP